MDLYKAREEDVIRPAIANSILIHGGETAEYYAQRFYDTFFGHPYVREQSVLVNLIPPIVRNLTQDKFIATLYTNNGHPNQRYEELMDPMYGSQTDLLVGVIRREERDGRIRDLDEIFDIKLPAIYLSADEEDEIALVLTGMDKIEGEKVLYFLLGDKKLTVTGAMKYAGLIGIIEVTKNPILWQ